VDVVTPLGGGSNLGWRFKEGFTTFRGPAPSGLTDPFLDYDRTTPLYGGTTVTGGYVYHGPGGANGLYVFGDFGSGNLWTVARAAGGAQDFVNRNGQLLISGGGDIDQISSFAVDGSQRLYVIGLDGDIHRLSPGPTAGDGSDYLRGEEGADQIFGGFGDDDVHGNTGNDTVSGGSGADWVVGGKDNDLLFGDEGGDIVYGNLGNDTCAGGPGADIVRGGQGSDVVSGGKGNDFVSGDLDDDTMSGGLGADIFNSFGGAGLDLVTDFNAAEGDRVRLDPGNTFTVSQEGADTVVNVAGGARVVLAGVQLSTLSGDWIFVG
jgi:Ca2+-binding RTX toxin-like protein